MHSLLEISDEPLKSSVQRASLLNIASRGVGLLTQLVTLIVLARLLSPSDFGVFAMVTPFVAILMIFGDVGLASAILQQRTLTQGQASAVFSINVLAGIGFGLLFLVCSPLLGVIYGDSRVVPVAATLSLLFLFSGFVAVQQSLLRRALRFEALLRAQVVGSAASLCASVVLALAGTGYWALVARVLVDSLAGAITIWLSTRWLPSRPEWDATTKSLVRYGQYFLGFRILTLVGRQGDNVLIGWRHGSIELGLYAVAYRIFLFPVQQITHPIGHVLIPALSRLHDEPDRMRRWYLESLRLITFVAFPPIFSLVVCAHDVLRLIAGPKWDAAADMLVWLAPVGALHVGFVSIGWLMQSQGRSDRNFYFAAIETPIYLAAFIIGLPWGGTGVAAAYAAANVVLFLPGFVYAAKGTPIRLRDVLRAMGPSFLTAAITLPLVHGAMVFIAADWDVLPRVLLAGVVITLIMAIGAAYLFGISTMVSALKQSRAALQKGKSVGGDRADLSGQPQ